MKDSVKIANDVSSVGNNIGMNVSVLFIYSSGKHISIKSWLRVLPKKYNPHCTPEHSDLDLPYKLTSTNAIWQNLSVTQNWEMPCSILTQSCVPG